LFFQFAAAIAYIARKPRAVSAVDARVIASSYTTEV
jgi:hypothetical protein